MWSECFIDDPQCYLDRNYYPQLLLGGLLLMCVCGAVLDPALGKTVFM